MPIPVPGRIAEALRKSTVQIRAGDGYRQGNGSGVIIGPEQIITNAHVLQGGRMTVESWEGKTLPLAVVKTDPRRDLALLAASGLNGEAVSLGDSGLLRPGTPVLAVGNPFGFVGALSSGVVHSVGRSRINMSGDFEWICADVRLAPGNSGGPLADFHGQVVGINTMIASGGLAFAVPSRAVQAFLLRSASPPSLGVIVRPVRLRSGQFGILILELVRGGAAEAASLLPGDIVIAANGTRLETGDDLLAAIDNSSGGLLRLDFYRGRQALRHVTARIQPEQVPSAA
ncbi:MAG: trypsin-like peptidase domain-containing protein [Acidobacteriaceae bacterium]|nr:trypsin-like peptidase domain-containing protein [Acidobacteriaceae bacterium]